MSEDANQGSASRTEPRQDLAALAHRFLAPGRVPAKPSHPDARSHRLTLKTPPGWPDGPGIELRVHERGSGPAALLVHGWRGQSSDWSALADRLVEGGFTVWLPDLPAHGHSGGELLSLPLAAQALEAVQAVAGPFTFAAAHSYGGAALVHAAATGLRVDRLALLAPPTHYGDFARRAARHTGVPAELMPEWIAFLAGAIGADPDSLDMRQEVQSIDQPALLVHSDDDTIVPFQAVQAVAHAWRGARWWPRQGLGHFKLLDDEATLEELLRFAGARPA